MKPVFAVTAAILAMASPSFAEKALFAGGCFWCVESDFESVEGVKEVTSGYSGGTSDNPSYKELGGHIEAAEIEYDPSIVSYETLVDLFFRSIDPTDDGGQFCDRGNAYRTAVFALDDSQKEIAKRVKARHDASGVLPKPIVTRVLDAGPFHPAEAYHQNYYKSSKIVFTRFGPQKKSVAYKKYREACGRDKRVKQLWGEAAFSH